MDEQLHQTIGKLLAQNEIMMSQQTQLYQELNSISEQNIELKEQLTQIAVKQEVLEKKFEGIVPDLQFVTNLKQRGIGIASVLGLFFAGLGYYFDKILKH